jgi:CheY-like chemotaxis protein
MDDHTLTGHSILVVEDEPLIALDLRQWFEGVGAHVFAATHLPHALRLAEHPDLSAAVLDYRLGQGDSSQIGCRLEERGIPFMFYSAYDDMHQIWPNAVLLTKPGSKHDLVDAVARVLARADQGLAAANDQFLATH